MMVDIYPYIHNDGCINSLYCLDKACQTIKTNEKDLQCLQKKKKKDAKVLLDHRSS